jgi:hypothetical protein
VVNTSFMMGGALGLAVLASVAAARTEALAGTAAGAPVAALNAGYHVAFAIGAVFALAAAIIGALRVHEERSAARVPPGQAEASDPS